MRICEDFCDGSWEGSWDGPEVGICGDSCDGLCEGSCDRLDVAIWEVLAIATARFPAMDRMMETARVLVMVVRCCDGSKVEISKGSDDGFY